MKLSNDKSMEGGHVKDNFTIGLVYGVVWIVSCTLHKQFLRES